VGRWSKVASLAVALGTATWAGCLVELDRKISCGDGFIDRLAGEECEPGTDTELWMMESCDDGTPPNPDAAVCNQSSCAIEYPQGDDPCQAAECGNGIKESGEQCDGQDFGDEICKDPSGKLLCRGPEAVNPCTIDRSICHCGDSVYQPDFEECEYRYECSTVNCSTVGGECDFGSTELCIVSPFGFEFPGFEPQQCVDLDDGINWGGGELRPLQHCTNDCVWNKDEACTMCGNGEIDGDEQCDGDQEDAAAKRDYCEQACAQQPLSIALDCNAPCETDCEFDNDPETIVDPVLLGCCVIREEQCSVDFPCCPGLECRTVAVGSQLEQRCVP